MQLQLIFNEVRKRYPQRLYFGVHGDVQPAQQRPVFEGYASHRVILTDNFPVPVPCNGVAEVIVDNKVVASAVYATPSHPDPYNTDAACASSGLKLASTASIPLPSSIPALKWIQLGIKGDKHVAQIKLQRVTSAHNIHSDAEGNMYLYTLDRVYLHVKV